MAKTDVYSWRLSPERRSELEEMARTEDTSIADLLDRVTSEWIQRRRTQAGADAGVQARLHGAVTRFVGALSGGDPDRARLARVRLKAKLAGRHGR